MILTQANDQPTRQRRGQQAEALAICHLVGQGFEVFTAFGNNSCDFIALKDTLAIRVEVKVATKMNLRADGSFSYGVIHCDPKKYDLLLVVLPDGTILADPKPEEVYGVPRRDP